MTGATGATGATGSGFNNAQIVGTNLFVDVLPVGGGAGSSSDLGQVVGSTGAVATIGVSGGNTFTNTQELLFSSVTEGGPFTATQSGNTTTITLDLYEIASRVGSVQRTWAYTAANDILNPSSGEIRQQTGVSRLLIHQVDSSGANTRTTWATVRDDIENYGESTIRITFGTTVLNYKVNAVTYSSPIWIFTISEGNDQVGGNGKTVNALGQLNSGTSTIQSASEFYRFPDGTTTESIVSSLNGLTGAVTLNAGSNTTVTNGSGGITIDSSSGIVANAGLTLNGSTLDVDSTQVIHVAASLVMLA